MSDVSAASDILVLDSDLSGSVPPIHQAQAPVELVSQPQAPQTIPVAVSGSTTGVYSCGGVSDSASGNP